MSQAHPNLRIERITDGLTVRHHDAVIASSETALLVHGEREAPTYYLPKDRVYFEHLTQTGGGALPDGRRAIFRSITASGGGVENAAWIVEDETVPELSGHVGFDPSKVSFVGV